MSTMDKLVLKVGEAHIIALQQLYGKPMPSRYEGDQLMFSLVDGRKLFVDPYVQDRFKAANVEPRVDFQIEKCEVMSGNRRTVEIQVRPVPIQPRTPAKPPQPTLPPPPAPQLPPAPPAPMNGAAPVNGQGETTAAIMGRCYIQAVDVALAAVQYAETKGLRITPGFEDIRALAATMCITETGGRR